MPNGGDHLQGLMLCWLQDYVGLRAIILLACAILTVPMLAVLAFTNTPPLICTIWLGILYSFVAVSLGPIFKKNI